MNGDKSGGGSPPAGEANEHTRPATSHKISGESGRSSKAKTHPARTSLNEMKRRVAAILEFVGRMQTERTTQLAARNTSGNGSTGSSKGTNTPNGLSKSSSGSSLSAAGGSTLPAANLVRAVEAGLKDVEGKMRDEAEESLSVLMEERDFGHMGSVDMMETLTKELVGWQNQYGVYSR